MSSGHHRDRGSEQSPPGLLAMPGLKCFSKGRISTQRARRASTSSNSALRAYGASPQDRSSKFRHHANTSGDLIGAHRARGPSTKAPHSRRREASGDAQAKRHRPFAADSKPETAWSSEAQMVRLSRMLSGRSGHNHRDCHRCGSRACGFWCLRRWRFSGTSEATFSRAQECGHTFGRGTADGLCSLGELRATQPPSSKRRVNAIPRTRTAATLAPATMFRPFRA